MFYEGNSTRAIGRIMEINKSTVYNWIKKWDEKLQNTDCTEKNTVAESKTT